MADYLTLGEILVLMLFVLVLGFLLGWYILKIYYELDDEDEDSEDDYFPF